MTLRGRWCRRARPLRSSIGEKPSRTIHALTQPMLLARQLDLAHVGREADAATHSANIAPRGRRPKPSAIETRCNPGRERLENIPKEVRARAEPPMFFTFPENAHWNAERRPWSSGSRSGSTAAWSASPDARFSACYRSDPPASDASRRTTSSAPSSRAPSGNYAGRHGDRGWERRDQLAGLALDDRTRHSLRSHQTVGAEP